MRRERRTTEEWKAIIVDQQSSGVSAREYCAKHNIHLQTFYARRSEINKKAVQTTSKLVKVLKSKLQLVSTMPPLTIIHNGVTLSLAQPVEAIWLADVMKALTL
ncbi:MAG: transposase [Paraglaciecola sp.]|uniref:IS66 family insertion sequence element accessory protein TnpA n=1 Tax=Flavobacterium sp. W21_SRS_FM6 TaxID=3240268 RepID=UPI00275696E0|nr:transposase [Paraglaciecola sp.]